MAVHREHRFAVSQKWMRGMPAIIDQPIGALRQTEAFFLVQWTVKRCPGAMLTFRMKITPSIIIPAGEVLFCPSSFVVSSDLGILHPIRLFQAHNLASLNNTRLFPLFVSHCGSRLLNLVIPGEDLHTTNMRILSILMVLQHAHLHHKCPQLGLASHTDALKIDIDPATRLFTTPFVELNLFHPPHQFLSFPSRSSEIETHKIIHASPTPELHLGRRVTFIQ